jgi:DNA-binding NtrC family response regulator
MRDTSERPPDSVNVLFVDDEVAFVEAVARRLSRLDIAVVAASGGDDAIRILAENDDIDVVVLDIRMPGMDGLQTLLEVKRLRSSMPVIILTGHGTVESAIKGMKLGAFDYLTKPCELETLVRRIRQAAGQREAAS